MCPVQDHELLSSLKTTKFSIKSRQFFLECSHLAHLHSKKSNIFWPSYNLLTALLAEIWIIIQSEFFTQTDRKRRIGAHRANCTGGLNKRNPIFRGCIGKYSLNEHGRETHNSFPLTAKNAHLIDSQVLKKTHSIWLFLGDSNFFSKSVWLDSECGNLIEKVVPLSSEI